MREKTIAQQHAERISPARVHRRLPATALGFVHDVVVHERGDVDQLDDDGKIDMSGVEFAGGAAGQEREQRSQTFSASADGVGNVTLNRRIERGGLACDPRVRLDRFAVARAAPLAPVDRDEEPGALIAGRTSGRNFHKRRIEGRLMACQSNTSRDF